MIDHGRTLLDAFSVRAAKLSMVDGELAVVESMTMGGFASIEVVPLDDAIA